MKVSSGVRGLSLGGDLSCLHIQRGEERGGAMPNVIMGLSGGLPRLQGQAGLGGRQGLNLGFFIHGQHQGMRWRLNIQANRLPRRAGEVGVRRDRELATTVRTRPCCRQMRYPGGRRLQGAGQHLLHLHLAGRGLPGGRVRSCSNPSTPSARYRSCHRHTCFCGVKGASAKVMDPKVTNYPLEDGLVQYESEIVQQFPQIPAR